MFIKTKNAATGRNINLIAHNIVIFEPSDEEGRSRVEMSNGRVVTVEMSERSIRSAIKKLMSDDDGNENVSGEPAAPQA